MLDFTGLAGISENTAAQRCPISAILRDVEAAGSNPVTPIRLGNIDNHRKCVVIDIFCLSEIIRPFYLVSLYEYTYLLVSKLKMNLLTLSRTVNIIRLR